MPFAEGEAAVDDLHAAEVEDGGLPQVGDEEDEREEEGEGAADADALLQFGVYAFGEASLFAGFAGEGFDDFEAGQVFLEDGVDFGETDLQLAEEGLDGHAEAHEDEQGEGQHGQDDQGEAEVG